MADQLRWFIASGTIAADEYLPPIRLMADRLGINLHTVSAAYGKLQKIGLIQTSAGKGSRVREFDSKKQTRRIGSGRNNTIGVFLPDLKSPFYTEFLLGVDLVARQERFLTMVYNTQGQYNSRASREAGLIYENMLMAKGLDGILIGPLNFSEGSGERPDSGLERLSIPIVFVDRPEVKRNVVNLDAVGAGRVATRHLLQHGHESIALITGKVSIPTLNNCFLGYKQTMKKNGKKLVDDLIVEVDDFSPLCGYQACRDLLSRGRRFTAIFAAGDTLAIGALRALNEAGLRVPEDIALVGYNDIDLAAYTIPPLTTVRAPIMDLGIQSTRMLIAKILGRKQEKDTLLLPIQLVVRKSCGCAAKKISQRSGK